MAVRDRRAGNGLVVTLSTATASLLLAAGREGGRSTRWTMVLAARISASQFLVDRCDVFPAGPSKARLTIHHSSGLSRG